MALDIDLRLLDPRYGSSFPLPAVATSGAAAIDLRAAVDAPLHLDPGSCVLIPSGIAIHIGNPGFAALLLPRSGLGHRGLVLGNGIGLIDSDYQGEIRMSCWNRGENTISIEPGDRIAQLLVIPVATPVFRIVDSFADTTGRGQQGFGHSGTR